jgi:hypothetical protein
MQFKKFGWMTVVFALAVAAIPARTQSVMITEFLASNSGGLLDEDGDTPDWIEIYNSATTSVDLAGWHLTDDTNNLTKWTFPSTTINPAGFLLVFASSKDRRVPGAPLHTSFNLDADGGYLALVQPDGVTIATEFHYPAQRANFSYGLAQSIQVTRLITNTQPIRVHVPSSPLLGNSWTTNDFDHSSWQAGTNGVGYETSVPGFAVRNFKANIQVGSLANAESVITNTSQQSAVYSENAAVVNYVNTGSGANYGGDRTFPGLTIGADVEDFVLEAVATVTIPAAGNWTFGVNSDDGFRLTVGSFTVQYDPPRGPGDTFGTFNFPSAGTYPLRLVYYERGGGAEVELFAAQGTFAAFNAGAFDLVGDVANGGLQVRSVPVSGGGGLGYRSFIRTDIQSQMLSNNATAFVRVPFTVNDAASFTSLTLQMRYDDGFIAYLNGTEVIRRFAPALALWNSTSTGPHLGADYEDINLTSQLSLLRNGANILAIHGLNQSANDSDFLVMTELAEYKPVGLTNQYFVTPSPTNFNGTGFAGFVADTKFSHDRGFYNTNFSLVITTATAGATIRYTTNGSTPTATTGTIYTGPVFINRTTTLRAAAFLTGLFPSDVDTQTYIYLNDVLTQSPTGARPTPEWPGPGAIPPSNQSMDYGMDPDIVNSATWRPMLSNSLVSIPSFSIVTDLRHLFDPATGIYANPSGDEKTWERPASLELIYPDGTDGFQINAGLRIRGGFSRSPDNPKHAFRLFFRQEYGDAKLNYPVFGPDGAEEFDKLDLRTFQNYSWAFQNDARMIGLRDQFSRDAQIAMGRPSTRGNFFHLYVNGQYWGLYNTEERSEASYGETYFGGRAEDYDTVKVDPDLGYNIEPTDGNLDAWMRLWRAATNGFTADADYFRVQGLNVDGTPNPAFENLVDVSNMIDYMLVIIYGGNLDAPISNFLSNNSPNNWFGIRRRNGNIGFRFFAHDSEHTLLQENINVDRTGPFVAGDPALGSTFLKSSPQYIWSRMSANAEFRLLVADHIQRHFFRGGVFSTEGARASFLARSNEIQSAIVAESARWGDAKSAVPYTRNHWVTEMNKLYTQFFVQRPAIVLAQLRADNLWPTLAAPTFSSYGGLVSAGFSLSMTNTNAAASTIYYTLDGSDPRLRGGNISPTAIAYVPNNPVPINASARVRARVRLNNSPFTWSPIVEAQFYVIQDFGQLLVSEIMYHPQADVLIASDQLEFLELKNAGTTTQDLSGLSFSSGIRFAFTNGTRVLPGQFFVIVRNATNFAARYPGVTVNGVFTDRLDNNGETLTLSHPLAGTLLTIEYNDAAPWPASADGYGFSLVPKDPNVNPDQNNPRNWRASSNVHGSPGADDPPSTVAPILINEALTRTDAGAADAIELFNPTGSTVDISGWYLTDDVARPRKFRIPDGTTIDAGGYRVFTEAEFNADPLNTNSFALSSLGDEVYLFSADLLGNVGSHSHGFRYGAANDGVTFGRYVISTGDEHFVSQEANTVGGANFDPLVGPIIVRQIMYHPFDLPGGLDNTDDEFIELRNISANAVPLFDPAFPTNTWRLRDAVDFNFPTNISVAPHSSVLVVSFDPSSPVKRDAFLAKYGLFTNVPIFGPYSGKLDNSRENIELYKPDAPNGNTVPYILVESIQYMDAAPWPLGTDGTGASLQRIALSRYGNDPTNWASFATLQIQAQPSNFFVRAGTNLAFSVAGVGSGPLTYQWQFNDVNIEGATNSSYPINNVQLVHDGVYTVTVSDTSGSVVSVPAVLRVLINPNFVTQPQTQTVLVGDDVTFTATIIGNPAPFGYSLRKVSTILTNYVTSGKMALFTLPNVQTNDSGSYRIVVTNAALPTPGFPSAFAILTVLVDTDGDRVPDAWESANGFNYLDPNDAAMDTDGDGMTNLKEYIAGTNPRDPQSYLKIETTGAIPGGGAIVRFSAVSNKTYTVEFAGNPAPSDWMRLTNISGAITNRSITLTNPAPGAPDRYYRLLTPWIQ